jgi:fructose-1,6-bisphosphatase I
MSRIDLKQYLEIAKTDTEMARIIEKFAAAGKDLANEIGRAALDGATGFTGAANATGDDQKKLDLRANDIVMDHLARSGLVAAVVSEELAEVAVLDRDAPFIVCTDPLDGSSNTDINGAIGTIFGLYRRKSANLGSADWLRSGSEQIAAGYVMYGTSTVLVYTTGNGAHGFTLDHTNNTFVLSHPSIRCPLHGKYFSANLGKSGEWQDDIRRYVDLVTRGEPSVRHPGSLRYAGALVADLHRTLLEGGLYFYPADHDHKSGKLRYLYESAPLAFIVEQAGGLASTGRHRILDLKASSIHQRTPLVIGSTDDVLQFVRFVTGDSAAAPAQQSSLALEFNTYP